MDKAPHAFDWLEQLENLSGGYRNGERCGCSAWITFAITAIVGRGCKAKSGMPKDHHFPSRGLRLSTLR